MTKHGRQTRLFYRAQYFRHGFAEVASPTWLAHLSDEERAAYRLRESFRAVHRDLARNAPKSRRYRADSAEATQASNLFSYLSREMAGNAFAEYVRLLKNRRSKH